MRKEYKVFGMSCVVCAQTIVSLAKATIGVTNASLSYATERLTIDVDERFNENAFLKEVEAQGYRCEALENGIKKVLKVGGMSCVACARTIEEEVASLPGIVNVVVNYASEKMKIEYREQEVNLEAIEAKIVEAGYTLKGEVKPEHEKRRLIISFSASFLLLFFAMGPMIGIELPLWIDPHSSGLTYALLQAFLATIVIVLGRTFFIRGYRNLFKGHPNMDSLVALGTSASFLYSLYATVRIALGDHDWVMMLYFEAVGVIISLVMLGKYLELRSKNKAKEALDGLSKLVPLKALIKRNETFEEILVTNLKVGDIVAIHAGEQVPTDGIVVEGLAAVNEAMITGEAIPAEKTVGSTVVGASVCVSGYLLVEVTKVGQDTILSKMIQMVEEAQNSKAPIARLADRVSGIFVPIVLAVSILAGLIWYFIKDDFSFALQISVSVLVIACPCSLGLATPIAIIVGTGVSATNGILFKSAEVLEETHKVKAIALDKTGTITSGEISVVGVFPAKGIKDTELIEVAASLEVHSSHPLAKAIMKKAQEQSIQLFDVENFKVEIGKGLEATRGQNRYFVGNETYLAGKLMPEELVNFNVQQQNLARTLVFVARDNHLIGLISLEDTIKESSREAIQELHHLGLEVILISGDQPMAAQAVANQLSIKEVYAGVLPQEKALILEELQERLGKVAMVGDGINDAVALARADVGIAVASGTQIAMSSADIILMKSDIRDVAFAIFLSKKTIKNIKENLFWAFGYNLIGLPIAAGLLYPFGLLLNPMIAALAMAFSSVSVVLNALRLKKTGAKLFCSK